MSNQEIADGIVAYLNHRKQWESAVTSEASRVNRAGSHRNHEFDSATDATIVAEYLDGARVEDFDTADRDRIVDAARSFGLTAAAGVDHLAGNFVLTLRDESLHWYGREACFVYFRPNGEFYAAHAPRLQVHARVLDFPGVRVQRFIGLFLDLLATAQADDLAQRERGWASLDSRAPISAPKLAIV